MAAHKGPANLRPRCTRGGTSVAAVPIKCSIAARSGNNCCSEKAITIIYCKGVSLVLIIKHAVRMRRVILSSVPCIAVPYITTLSHK
jgi:hypothetical protein